MPQLVFTKDAVQDDLLVHKPRTEAFWDGKERCYSGAGSLPDPTKEHPSDFIDRLDASETCIYIAMRCVYDTLALMCKDQSQRGLMPGK